MVKLHNNNIHIIIKVLISKHGEVGDSEYLDPRGNQVITFDHIKQEVTGSHTIDGELDADVEPFR